MSDIIDINVYETTEEVTINVTPNVIEVNINKVTGVGGGTQTLAQTLGLGNTTGGENILVNNADAIELENSSLIRKGTYDFGGNGGISKICSVGYEDMWQSGIRHVFDNNGLIRNSTNCFNIVPDTSFDVNLRFKVGSIWTLDDGTSYICTDATENEAVWGIYNSISNLVPYTGANDNVNIGTNDLYANKVFLYDEPNDNYGSIHYADGDFHVEDADGHKLLVIEDGFMQLHLSDTIQSNLYTTDLTQTRNHYLPNNSGIIALTSDITGINSGTNTGDETATTIKDKLGITTLSGSNTGDQDLSNLVVKNTAITGATKTKITYDSKGLVTGGADATTADIADSINKRYQTDNQNSYNDATSSIQTQLNAKQAILGYTPYRFNKTTEITHTGTTAKTILQTILIPANTFTAGDFIDFSAIVTKVLTTSTTAHTIEINTTNTLTGALLLASIGFNLTNVFMKVKREFIVNSGNIYAYTNQVASTPNDNSIGQIGTLINTQTYNLSQDLYLFVTCTLSTASETLIYRGISLTKK